VKKTAEQIDMPFAGITHVRPRNYPGNIDGVQNLHGKGHS